jgi:DNA-binding NarL/FixJ family response regulator
MLCFRLGDPDASLGYLHKALLFYRTLGWGLQEAITTANIATVHMGQGRGELALESYHQALAIYRKIDDQVGYADMLISIGEVHMGMDEHDAALHHFEEALAMVSDGHYPQFQCKLHELIAISCERTGELQRSLEHYKLLLHLKSELNSSERMRVVAQVQARADIERIEQEKEEYRRKVVHLEAEVESRQREMTTMTLRLIEKRELVSSIQEQIISLPRSHRQGATELAGPILDKLRESFNSEAGWQAFEQQFQHLNSGFMQMMRGRYPGLTSAELKVCSLLKIGLTTKDIAGILHTSVRTVEGHRNHIRRKLAIPADITLPAFLATL